MLILGFCASNLVMFLLVTHILGIHIQHAYTTYVHIVVYAYRYRMTISKCVW